MSVASPRRQQRFAELIGRLTVEQKVRLLAGAGMWSLPGERAIGLRGIVFSDGPAGVRGPSWDERDSSASLPSPTSMAASWDPDLVGRLGALLASEARRKGVDVVLGPTVNLHRSPRGGRHFEAFSEDPWLTGEIGVAYVRGLQGEGVGATVKHYVANDSETDRMSVDVEVDERTLREIYLQPFERIVREGGSWLVMSAYNSVAGTTMSANALLRSPLKEEWGFDGVVVSDWGGVRDTAASAASAQDLAMPGPSPVWDERLVDAVRRGEVDEAAIDEKVARLVRLAERVGALEGSEPARPARAVPALEVSALLREAAAEGMVLVRNDGLLPIDPGARPRVAVIGDHAAHGRNQGGGSATVFPEHVVSPLDGLRKAFGEDRVVYRPGVRSITGLLPFDRSLVHDPVTGEPGLRVRLLGEDGSVLRDEHRLVGRLLWLGDPTLQQVAEVDADARFVAPAGGRYALGFQGLGHFRFEIDGRTSFDDLVVPEDVDPVVAFLRPPSRTFPVDLEAGQVVHVRLRHRPHLIPELPVVHFAIGYEEPVQEPAVALEEAVRAAAEADVAVVVVGTTEALESEGFDRSTLALPAGQDDLVRRVVAANPRAVVLVNSGAPVLLPWLDEVPAVALTWFPGQEMGDAIADVLSGRREPGGRMPTTWAAAEADVPVWQVDPVGGKLRYGEGLQVGYREWTRRQRLGGPRPAIPFGHGLGYTSWQVASTALEAERVRDAGVDVSAVVRNTGARAGKQTLQAYCSRVSPSALERPPLWLAGFATVRLDAGASATARLRIRPRSLEHWSVEHHAWELEPGTYAVRLGTSIANLGEALEFTVV